MVLFNFTRTCLMINLKIEYCNKYASAKNPYLILLHNNYDLLIDVIQSEIIGTLGYMYLSVKIWEEYKYKLEILIRGLDEIMKKAKIFDCL